MSDGKKCFKKRILIILSSLAIFLSVLSLAISGILIYKLSAKGILQDPVVISKQYDKGQNMEKALDAKKPVIVWFYTDWCGFCQRFAPTFGKITKNKKIKKHFAVAYVNAENPENDLLTKEYNIMGFPTVYLYNPETKEKVQVGNEKLFAADADKDLVEEFLEFAGVKADDKKAEKKDEKGVKEEDNKEENKENK